MCLEEEMRVGEEGGKRGRDPRDLREGFSRRSRHYSI
jgi:hypothetical protein